ncbi:DUF2783 domain-containing protein [Polycladidibacter hongkongensis]|uniref:DUF2783 domain-containing protein n=1 Tax=Polycladidibacter hongkongensis TaxID=1647556 RepID=UPI0008374509|nr:DUF2783 domain-containing protein [Pseudovibrio hongkongensis]
MTIASAKLEIKPNIIDPDGFYNELLNAHEGLSEAQSTALNARLVLILANHIGARDVLSEAFRLAKAAGTPS